LLTSTQFYDPTHQMDQLLSKIRNCIHCKEHLPLGPRPIVAAHPASKIAIIGQAPGTKVHQTGIPWDDPSGRQLRKWLGVTDEQFYNEQLFALIPMGFCYPGKGKSGDLPPRPECAPLWHESLVKQMPSLKLIILIGQYAQNYYLGNTMKRNLFARLFCVAASIAKKSVLVEQKPMV